MERVVSYDYSLLEVDLMIFGDCTPILKLNFEWLEVVSRSKINLEVIKIVKITLSLLLRMKMRENFLVMKVGYPLRMWLELLWNAPEDISIILDTWHLLLGCTPSGEGIFCGYTYGPKNVTCSRKWCEETFSHYFTLCIIHVASSPSGSGPLFLILGIFPFIGSLNLAKRKIFFISYMLKCTVNLWP